MVSDARSSAEPSGTHHVATQYTSAPDRDASRSMPPPPYIPAQAISDSSPPEPRLTSSQPENRQNGVPVILQTNGTLQQASREAPSNRSVPAVIVPTRPSAHPPTIAATSPQPTAPTPISIPTSLSRRPAVPIVVSQTRPVSTESTRVQPAYPSQGPADTARLSHLPAQAPRALHGNRPPQSPPPVDFSQIDPSLRVHQEQNASLAFSSNIEPHSYPPPPAHTQYVVTPIAQTAHSKMLPPPALFDPSIAYGVPLPGMEGGLTAGTEIHPSQEQSSKRKRGRAATATDSTDPSAVKPTRKRSRRASGDQSHGDEDSAAEGSKRKRKPRDPNTPRKSRKRVPSPPPFDPSVEPGEELDPTVVTMSALCVDSGQGRVSSKAAQIVSNHAAWRAANREKRTRLKAIMEAKKYGRNPDDEEQPASGANRDATANPEQTHADHVESEEPVAGPSTRTDNQPAHEPRGDDNFDYSNDFSTSRYNVQVRIGANGETIIDEESLFVSRNEEDETENYTHVEESDTTKFVNSQSYSKKARGSRWSAEETELFYDVRVLFDQHLLSTF